MPCTSSSRSCEVIRVLLMSCLMHIVGRNLAIRCEISPNTLWLTQVRIPLYFSVRLGVVFGVWLFRNAIACSCHTVPKGDANLVLSKEFWSCWSFWCLLAGTRSQRCYFEKIKCSKQAYALNTLALNNVLGLWSSSGSKTIRHRP